MRGQAAPYSFLIPGLVDDLLERRDFLGQARPGGLSAFRPDQKSGLKQLVLHFGCRKDFERFALEPCHVGRRRLGRREQHHVGCKDEIFVAGLFHCRHIGQFRPAAFAADRKTALTAT